MIGPLDIVDEDGPSPGRYSEALIAMENNIQNGIDISYTWCNPDILDQEGRRCPSQNKEGLTRTRVVPVVKRGKK